MKRDQFYEFARLCHRCKKKYTVGYSLASGNPCVIVDGDSVFCEVDKYSTSAHERVIDLCTLLNARVMR